jgi:hypothetical protein
MFGTKISEFLNSKGEQIRVHKVKASELEK